MGEEIIVNGVDISECRDYDEFEGLFLCTCKEEGMTPYCLDNPNCWYKEKERIKMNDISVQNNMFVFDNCFQFFVGMERTLGCGSNYIVYCRMSVTIRYYKNK